ncbi:MAG: DUF2621 family protein [Candidatus Omnitrophota bacterium]
MNIEWNQDAKSSFDKVISNLPQFHRSIAERLVKEKARELANQRNSQIVENQDVVRAFFQEVPPAFKDMMKRLFSQLNIDCCSYADESGN